MKKFLFVIILMCSSVLLFAQGNENNVKEKIRKIENGVIEFKSFGGMFYPDSAQLANRLKLTDRMKNYNVPGLSIAVINNYKIEWAKAYGIMDVNSDLPVTDNTLFEAASTSKLITAVIALHLVEKGKLNLDADVNQYLKTWKVPESELTKLEKVTLRRLLTHQAGLPQTNFNEDESGRYPSLLDVLNGKAPALNKPAFPEVVPGSKWLYSNVGYVLIQLILEEATNKKYADLAYEIVFKPLNMNNSTFSYPLNEKFKKQEAMPHNKEGKSCTPSMHLTAFAHAGLVTTPTDLAKFSLELMLANKGKSQKLLSQNMAKQLFTVELMLDPKIFGAPVGQGLGCLLNSSGDDLQFAHPGNNYPGMISWLIGWPNKGIGFIIMSNGALGEPLSIEIITALVQEYIK